MEHVQYCEKESKTDAYNKDIKYRCGDYVADYCKKENCWYVGIHRSYHYKGETSSCIFFGRVYPNRNYIFLQFDLLYMCSYMNLLTKHVLCTYEYDNDEESEIISSEDEYLSKYTDEEVSEYEPSEEETEEEVQMQETETSGSSMQLEEAAYSSKKNRRLNMMVEQISHQLKSFDNMMTDRLELLAKALRQSR